MLPQPGLKCFELVRKWGGIYVFGSNHNRTWPITVSRVLPALGLQGRWRIKGLRDNVARLIGWDSLWLDAGRGEDGAANHRPGRPRGTSRLAHPVRMVSVIKTLNQVTLQLQSTIVTKNIQQILFFQTRESPWHLFYILLTYFRVLPKTVVSIMYFTFQLYYKNINT